MWPIFCSFSFHLHKDHKDVIGHMFLGTHLSLIGLPSSSPLLSVQTLQASCWWTSSTKGQLFVNPNGQVPTMCPLAVREYLSTAASNLCPQSTSPVNYPLSPSLCPVDSELEMQCKSIGIGLENCTDHHSEMSCVYLRDIQ